MARAWRRWLVGSAVSWKTKGCYVWRTNKPHALLGFGLRWMLLAAAVSGLLLWVLSGPWWIALALPLFSGRHTAYVGQTGSRYFRDRQHLYGDQRYGAAGKPWADLNPRVYPLPCLFPSWKWSREFNENLWIGLLLPVYNVKGNKRNPRRIKQERAQTQRWTREKSRQSMEGWMVRAIIMLVRVCLTAAFWIAVLWVAIAGKVEVA